MADYNRDILGVNTIPADTQSRIEYPNWRNWQDKPIPQSQHEDWKASGAFSKEWLEYMEEYGIDLI